MSLELLSVTITVFKSIEFTVFCYTNYISLIKHLNCVISFNLNLKSIIC